MPQRYEILYTNEAEEMLVGIQDRRVQGKIADLVDSLADSPESRGKALLHDLLGFRSLRAIGQRYRIVYLVDTTTLQVVIVGVGLRKEGNRDDIYEKVRRVVRGLKQVVAVVGKTPTRKNHLLQPSF